MPLPRFSIRHDRALHADSRQRSERRAAQSHARQHLSAQEAHGFIYAWYGEPQIEYPPLPVFDVIDDSFSYQTLKHHWATHYSRAIENQLDVVHLPFIHRSTIGRGNKTIVNGPLSRLVS